MNSTPETGAALVAYIADGLGKLTARLRVDTSAESVAAIATGIDRITKELGRVGVAMAALEAEVAPLRRAQTEAERAATAILTFAAPVPEAAPAPDTVPAETPAPSAAEPAEEPVALRDALAAERRSAEELEATLARQQREREEAEAADHARLVAVAQELTAEPLEAGGDVLNLLSRLSAAAREMPRFDHGTTIAGHRRASLRDDAADSTAQARAALLERINRVAAVAVVAGFSAQQVAAALGHNDTLRVSRNAAEMRGPALRREFAAWLEAREQAAKDASAEAQARAEVVARNKADATEKEAAARQDHARRVEIAREATAEPLAAGTDILGLLQRLATVARACPRRDYGTTLQNMQTTTDATAAVWAAINARAVEIAAVALEAGIPAPDVREAMGGLTSQRLMALTAAARRGIRAARARFPEWFAARDAAREEAA